MPPTITDQKEPEAKQVISTGNSELDKRIADGFLPRCFSKIEGENDTGKRMLTLNRKIRHRITQVAII